MTETIDPKQPFKVGDRIVDRAEPALGALIVGKVYRVIDYWRVAASNGRGSIVDAPATMFSPVPPGWREPPPLPASARVAAEFGSPTDIAAARLADEMPEARAMRAAAYREQARWWREVGALPLFSPERAAEQAAGFKRLALSLELT